MPGDGRSVEVRHPPHPDGGWMSAHEDVTELQRRLLIEERRSSQRLIDAVPDNLRQSDGRHRRTDILLDEIPGASKDIDEVMENAEPLVEVWCCRTLSS